MAVNSKADKTGGHKSSGLKKTSYSKAQLPPPSAGQLVPAGAKALMFRARKELAPLADPTQSPSI